MRFYVASAAIEIERAERMISTLRELGHFVTCDWPAAMRAETKRDHELTSDERLHYARADLAGVRQAECLIFLAPTERGRGAGCWVELGAALILGVPVLTSGDVSRSIFAELAQYKFASDAELDRALRLQDSRGGLAIPPVGVRFEFEKQAARTPGMCAGCGFILHCECPA